MGEHTNRHEGISIVGFDSAWVDSPRAPGAICSITIGNEGLAKFEPPILASFNQALAFIERQRSRYALCIVALDQPTIVPNMTSLRPVERVAASMVSYTGGGVQPSNRSKKGMFDEEAPIWRFKAQLEAIEEPELSRIANQGLYLIEVFPALALAGFEPAFGRRLAGPRYNPNRKKTFRYSDWLAVISMVKDYGIKAGIDEINPWIEELTSISTPRKQDQDRLDAALCALIGYHWRIMPRTEAIMIGDLYNGYMVSPVSPEMRSRLEAAARKCGVPVDASVNS
jgi:predicted RNase H-like nuclease